MFCTIIINNNSTTHVFYHDFTRKLLTFFHKNHLLRFKHVRNNFDRRRCHFYFQFSYFFYLSIHILFFNHHFQRSCALTSCQSYCCTHLFITFTNFMKLYTQWQRQKKRNKKKKSFDNATFFKFVTIHSIVNYMMKLLKYMSTICQSFDKFKQSSFLKMFFDTIQFFIYLINIDNKKCKKNRFKQIFRNHWIEKIIFFLDVLSFRFLVFYFCDVFRFSRFSLFFFREFQFLSFFWLSRFDRFLFYDFRFETHVELISELIVSLIVSFEWSWTWSMKTTNAYLFAKYFVEKYLIKKYLIQSQSRFHCRHCCSMHRSIRRSIERQRFSRFAKKQILR